MSESTGIVFQIQRFCIDDGPGLRTTIFLKGCHLNCSWCHNPEGKSKKISLSMDYTRCIHCGLCTTVCSCHEIKDSKHIYNSKSCTACGKCIDICPAKAISYCGKKMTVSEVLHEVKSDMNFYKTSSGGLTLSGGEVLLQPTFAAAVLESAQKLGIHTCIETSGAATWNTLYTIIKYADLILLDIKETNDIQHQKYIGISNKIILSNLEKLQELKKHVILRCPIIPGVNDRDSHFNTLAKIFSTYSYIEDIQILPYHNLGTGKTDRYGILDSLDSFNKPSDETISNWKKYLKEQINKYQIYEGDFL